MSPKILVFSHKKILCQLLSEYLDKQYEIIYCDEFLKNYDFMLSEQNVYMYMIEEFNFTKEIGELVQKIKGIKNAPILFLTRTKPEHQRIEEKVQAIEYGVDEYLMQPQSVEEILASVKALVRWHLRSNDNMGVWEFQGFRLYPKSRKIFINEKEILFTRIEFDIVQYLAAQNGRVVTYKELYEQVWKHKYILDDRNIMVHIHRMRKKLEPDPQNPVYIHNVYGVGYRFGHTSDKNTSRRFANLHPLQCMV